jgi:hypothetical protein
VIVKIKDLFSREKNTDHYGGLFNVTLWNSDGKIMKRVDPVGLTFGAHYGTKEKIYTKLKTTLENVLVEEGGEWSQQKLGPVGEGDKTIRVKMLETEYVKTPQREVRNVTDYLAEVEVKGAGKALRWSMGGEVPPPEGGNPDTHTYWEFAE